MAAGASSYRSRLALKPTGESFAPPPVKETTDAVVIRFPVHGTTIEDVATWLDVGVGDRLTQNFHAYTRYDARFRYFWKGPTPGVELTSVEIMFFVRTALPAWVDCLGASPHDAAEWERYLGALSNHERGHERIGLAAKATLVQRIETIVGRVFASPDEAASCLEHIKADVMRMGSACDKAYDDASNHGAKEGAVLGFEGEPESFEPLLRSLLERVSSELP